MAAIPDAECARDAHRGVMRALCRVAVLSGLVIAGWLLGAGISHADEDPGGPRGSDLTQIASATPAPPSEDGSDGSSGSFDVGKIIKSTAGTALSPTPVSRVPIQPPVGKRGVLTPLHKPLTSVVKSISIPRRLTHALTPVTRILPVPAQHSPTFQPPAPAGTPAAAPTPKAAPAVRAAVATPPVPMLTPDTRTGPTNITACAPAPPAAQHTAAAPVLHRAQQAPTPAAPPNDPPVTCMIGSTGGGTSTRSTPDVTQADRWMGTSLVPIHTLRSSGASDLPRSLAAQPSTSPD
ncbi:MAG: hypothetical protein ACRDSH_00745 [Pseudonocardiaceae bacterium]